MLEKSGLCQYFATSKTNPVYDRYKSSRSILLLLKNKFLRTQIPDNGNILFSFMDRSNQNRVSIWQPLTIRNFLLLFIGKNISVFGDRLYLVALPWLTIELTNSGLSLGTVLMAGAIPRTIFILVGGAISDRTSPR